MAFILLLCAASACNSGAGAPVEHARFVALQSDVLVTAQFRYPDSARRAIALDSVYRAHGIDTALARVAAAWYASRPDERARLQNDIIARLEKRAAKMTR